MFQEADINKDFLWERKKEEKNQKIEKGITRSE